jgi:hypothetical protein
MHRERAIAGNLIPLIHKHTHCHIAPRIEGNEGVFARARRLASGGVEFLALGVLIHVISVWDFTHPVKRY